jgi:hypothetical protein
MRCAKLFCERSIWENGGIRVNMNSQSILDWEFADFEDKIG